MIHTTEKLSPTQITVTVRVPYAELGPFFPKAAETISSEVDIEGFRKGKAPYGVVKNAVGEFKILEEAARLSINESFDKVLRAVAEKEFAGKSFEPVGDPIISVTKLAPDEELEFKITLSLLPQVALSDYAAIAKRVLAARRVPETTDAEVTAAIGELRESRAKLVTMSRGAQAGDRIEVDFAATHGGVSIEGGESKRHPLILGQARFLPGFEDALLGMKAGDKREFSLPVPQDYGEKRMAGKVLAFKTEMRLVQAREVPEWNDEFAKSLGNFSSAKDADARIREGLAREKESKERERLRMEMADEIARATSVELPEPLVTRELDKMLGELAVSLEGMGLKFDDYLTHLKKTADDLRREWRDDASRRVKIALVLREIARKEKIEPNAEDIEHAARRIVQHRGINEEDMKNLHPYTHGGEAPEAQQPITPMRVGIDREEFLAYNRGIARNEKVFKFLEELGS